jgi:hypothetical protein
VLKYSGGLLLHRISGNPVLASSVVLVGLLIWMNLAARLTLLVAGWSAITAIDRGHLEVVSRTAGGGTSSEGPRRGSEDGPRCRSGGRQGDWPRAGESGMARSGMARSGMARSGMAEASRVQGTGRVRTGGLRSAGVRTAGLRGTGRTRPSPYARQGPPMSPTFGQRSGDRVSLAAGFVLGVGALVTVGVFRRGLGALREVVRR